MISHLSDHCDSPPANAVRAGQSIRLENISRFWGDTVALQDVSFDVEAGSFTALLGPSGCGKSTALRLISGLETATAGRVLIGDQDVTSKAPAARDIAMVFQSYALFPHLNVAENIVFGLRVRKLSRSKRNEKLQSAARLLGLEQLLDRKPSQLSGGQQQRVALGRAIVAEKSVFLMDEPLSNLDAKLRAEMREEIRALQQRLGVTMLYVTHDQVEAVTMADQVVLMNQGRIEQVATPRDMYQMPASLFAAQFIGTPPMVTFSPKVLGSVDERITLGLRPESLQLSATGPIQAEVTDIEYLGADAVMSCKVGEEALLCRLPGKTVLPIGDLVHLSFDSSELHAFDKASGQRMDVLPDEINSIITSQIPSASLAP